MDLFFEVMNGRIWVEKSGSGKKGPDPSGSGSATLLITLVKLFVKLDFSLAT